MIVDAANANYAVIFTSVLKERNKEYLQTAIKMEELAQTISGFIGMESVRDNQSLEGISISYWNSLEAIEEWKKNAHHKIAKAKGKNEWYKMYKTRITQVIKDY